ncbi:MAG TPA: hypothetical protein VKU90_08270 [Caulobacteraceae bacterium]|nr:hypothetical protein [Caulobacteraceae bacterium]
MRTTTVAAAALMLAAAPTWAAPETSCPAVATAIRAMPPPSNLDKDSDLVDGPLARLAARPGAPIQLDASAPLSAEAAAALPATVAAGSPKLAAALAGMDLADVGDVWLRKAGGLTVVETEAGTLDCSNFIVFESAAGTPARLAPDPPQVVAGGAEGDGATPFCGMDEGLVGVVAGAPLFAENGWDATEPNDLLVLSTWRNGRWTDPCEIDVRYRRTYAVADAFCDGAACAAIAKAAVDMASRREAQIAAHGDVSAAPATFAWGPAASAADRAKVARLKGLFGSANGQGVPTLGKGDAPVHGFGDDTVMFPARIGGATYLAVLGHGSVGWRIYPDFVLGLYDMRAGQLAPVAGFHIDRQVVGPVSVTLHRWTPPPKAKS